MISRAVKFTFPLELAMEPIICSLGQQSKIATNIRRAHINGDKGWAVLDLEGEREDVEGGIARATGKGMGVDSVIAEIVEG